MIALQFDVGYMPTDSLVKGKKPIKRGFAGRKCSELGVTTRHLLGIAPGGGEKTLVADIRNAPNNLSVR